MRVLPPARCGVGLLLLVAAVLAVGPAGAGTGTRSFSVEAREPGAGRVPPLGGVNAGPWTPPDLPDLLDSYRYLRVAQVRTHDFYGYTDLAYLDGSGIFPDMSRDPDDPDAYHFGPADEVVREILDSGAEVYYRLGYSWEDPPEHNAPPADPEKFARVAAHVVAHFNRGWNGGHQWGIRYWEFWNEPDLEQFWTGTPGEFYRLYELSAREMKRVDPSILVGAAGISDPFDADYREGFLRYCRERGVPLDFFSWHHYEDHQVGSPGRYREMAESVRAALDGEGFPRVPQVISEWHHAPLWTPFHCNTAGAAFNLVAMSGMADDGVGLAHVYRGDDRGVFCEEIYLHRADGTRKPPAYAVRAWALLGETPERRRADGGDWRQASIYAGRSEDGRTMRVLLVNYDDPGMVEFRLTVRGLGSCGVERTVRREVLESDGFRLADEFSSGDDPLVVTGPAAKPSVILLTIGELAPWPGGLRAGTGACPGEGPTIAWDPVPGASGYRLYRADTSCEDALAAAEPVAEVAETEWTDPAGGAGATRFYAVEPVAAYGNCDGDRRCIAAGCPPPAPAPVEGLRVERRDGDLLLSWEEAEGAASYRVRRATDPDPVTWGIPWRTGVTDEDPASPGVQWTDPGAAGTDPPAWFYLVEGEPAPAGP